MRQIISPAFPETWCAHVASSACLCHHLWTQPSFTGKLCWGTLSILRLWFFKGIHKQCACVWVLSHVWLFVTLWTVALQAPLSDFSGKNTGVGCHAHLQGIVLTQGLNPHLHIAGRFFTTETLGEALQIFYFLINKLFLVALDCCCLPQALSSCSKGGLLFDEVWRLLTVMASLAVAPTP